MPEMYDVQQVCENGHQITGGYNTRPEERKKFCQECGAPTITSCPGCGIAIRGSKFITNPRISDARYGRQRMTLESIASVPSYCSNCGEPYPWTKRKLMIEESIQAFIESGKLDEEEKKTVGQDIENISKNLPDTKPSAIRIKKIWEKYGPIAYEAVMEFSSRTAAKILKGP
jgi:hypothetical protein